MSEQSLVLPKLAPPAPWSFEREARYRVNVVDTITDLCAAVKGRPLNAANGAAVAKARHVVNQLFVGTFTEDAERILDCAERAIYAVRTNDHAVAEHLSRMNGMLQRLRLNVLADRRRRH